METTLFKTKAVIDSDLNLKWWIFKNCKADSSNATGLRIEHLENTGTYIKVKVFNGTLYTGNSGCTFVNTEILDDVTINNYLVGPSINDSKNTIRLTADADKIMVERGNWYAAVVGTSTSNLNGENNIKQIALHSPRKVNEVYPLGTDNEIYMSYSKAYGNIEDILEVIPYYSGIRMQGNNIQGNINGIADYIEPENYPVYSSGRNYSAFFFQAVYGNTGLSGNLITILERLKQRGKTNFRFIYSLPSNSSIVFPEGHKSGEVLFDNNGNYTFL